MSIPEKIPLKILRKKLAQSLLGNSKTPKTINGLAVTSLEDFVTESLVLEGVPFLGATMRPFPADELQAYLGRIQGGEKEKAEKYKLPYIHRGNITIQDGSKAFDLDTLRKQIMTRPTTLLKQNEKMTHSDGSSSVFFNVGLPALKGLAVNETTGEFVIVDTCPGAGQCKVFCYAMKGGYVQWKASSMAQTKVLNFLLNDPEGFKAALKKELQKASEKFALKGTQVVLRWHDAGDFFSPDYLDLAFEVARAFPKIDFYAYTKMASAAQASRPDNFKMNFSQGAQPSQEKQIEFARTKHSKVVQRDLFWDLIAKKGVSLLKDAKGRMQFTNGQALETFKSRMAKHYALQVASILTYDEMMETPKSPPNTWNVIVMPGDGDDSANRSDVLGTYLLFH